MGKEIILATISERLKEIGVSYLRGNATDLTIAGEFLDAGWRTGSKKITYEAAILADEAAETVLMWQLTKEEGHGLSFGGESESFSQQGKTLFRKVRNVQYGPDGKAYEFNLDLGVFPKIVKEAAKQSGWKFKTVLSRKKALYPAGYRALPERPVESVPPGLAPKAVPRVPVPKGKTVVLGLLGFFRSKPK